MSDCYTFEQLFELIEKDISKSIDKVSEQVMNIWKQLVEDRWYGTYSPTEYIRSFETLESISIIKVDKSSGNYSVSISYDDTKIHPFTYMGKTSGIEREGHTDISNQWNIVENGMDMPSGYFRDGSHAYEEMLKYVRSNDFLALFNVQLKKLGYIVK